MPIAFTCPHCGHPTNAAEQYAGQSGPCAGCGRTVTVLPLAGPIGDAPPAKRFGLLTSLFLAVVGVFLLLVCGGLLWILLGEGPEAGRRAQCVNNLKQIALAMHNYHDRYGRFPPAYVPDTSGRAIHSWRALLLPFLNKEVAAQYRFDEPWDSPSNRELTDSGIPVFCCPSDLDGAANRTNYVMIVGSGMLSNGTSSNSVDQITDGPANTIMIVEVVDSGIAWAEPRDLGADKISFKINDSQTCGISSPHWKCVECALCDGSVRLLSEKILPKTLSAMCTIAGGERIDESDWLK